MFVQSSSFVRSHLALLPQRLFNCSFEVINQREVAVHLKGFSAAGGGCCRFRQCSTILLQQGRPQLQQAREMRIKGGQDLMEDASCSD